MTNEPQPEQPIEFAPLGALVEGFRVRRLDRQAPLGGLRAGDAIAGEQ